MSSESRSKAVSPIDNEEIDSVNHETCDRFERVVKEENGNDINGMDSDSSNLPKNDSGTSTVNTGDNKDIQRMQLLQHRRLQLQIQRQNQQQPQVIAYAPNQVQAQQYVLVPACQLSSTAPDISAAGTGNEAAYIVAAPHNSPQQSAQGLSSHQPVYILQPHQQYISSAMPLQTIQPRISVASVSGPTQAPLTYLNCHVTKNNFASQVVAHNTAQRQLDLQMQQLNHHNWALQQHISQLQRELQGQPTYRSQAFAPKSTIGSTANMSPPQRFVTDSQETTAQQDTQSSRLQQPNRDHNQASARRTAEKEGTSQSALSMQPLVVQYHPSFTTANQQLRTSLPPWATISSSSGYTPSGTRVMYSSSHQSQSIAAKATVNSNSILKSHVDDAIDRSNASKQQVEVNEGDEGHQAQLINAQPVFVQHKSSSSCEIASVASELPKTNRKQQNSTKKRKNSKKSPKSDDASDIVSSEDGSIELERPKRPMTAYNFFFKAERARMLGIDNNDDAGLPALESSESTNVKTETAPLTSERCRVGRRTPHRKISFEDMARTISKKWKLLDAESIARFQVKADKEKTRYRNEKAIWLAKKKKRKRSKGQEKRRKLET